MIGKTFTNINEDPLQKKLKKMREAIKLKDIEAVREILSTNPKIVRSSNTYIHGLRSPLWEAMICGHEEIIEFLIDNGADVNEVAFEKNNFFGLTFVQYLAYQNNFSTNSKKVAEILIRRGANVNPCFGKTMHFKLLYPKDMLSIPNFYSKMAFFSKATINITW